MKRNFIVFILLTMCVSSFSQNKVLRLSKRAHEQEIVANQTPVPTYKYSAGDYLCKSAYMQYLSIGTGVVGVLLISTGIDKDNKALTRTGYITTGIAAVCEFASIHYKLKAGKQMKLSAGSNGLTASISF